MKHLIAIALFVLTACQGTDVDTYRAGTPTLDMRQYMNGKLFGHGLSKDWAGDVTERFTIDVNGAWEGNQGVITQDFSYDDGRTEHREWHVTVDDAGLIRGRTENKGNAVKGSQKGNALAMDYSIRRADGADANEFDLTERLYLIDDLHAIDEVQIRRYELPVGKMHIAYRKLNEWN